MKILALFLHSCEYGKKIRGDERRFLEVIRQFKDQSTQIYVVEWYPSLRRGFKDYKLSYISLEINPPKKKIFKIPYAILNILNMIKAKNIDFDVIYTHNQDIENVLVGFTLKMIFRKPLVVVLHWECESFEKECLRNLKRGNIFSLFLLLISLFIKKFIFPRVDLMFTINKVVRNYAINNLNLQPRKVVVSGNGVDTKKFVPQSKLKIYDVVFFSRVDFSQKGVDTLLMAWKEVINTRPSSRLVIVGGFHNEEENKLKDMITKLHLKGKVIYTGFVSDDKVIEILNKSRLFVLPTRFDGFSLATLEAMSCGLPCILSDIPTLRRIYNNVAIFVKPNDHRSLARRILSLLDADERLKELSITSRVYARRYRWENVAKKEVLAMRHLLQLSPVEIISDSTSNNTIRNNPTNSNTD